MDENYNLLPHGVNFQDPIFPTHRKIIAYLQIYSTGIDPQIYSPDWEAQEDSRLMCDSVQRALLEEEERSKTLSQKVRFLEKANAHLREKVKNLKRALRQATEDIKKEVLSKQLLDKDKSLDIDHPKQSKKIISRPTKKATGNRMDS
ncbi:unnamed protein product, partial [Ranitomeya imitator]